MGMLVRALLLRGRLLLSAPRAVAVPTGIAMGLAVAASGVILSTGRIADGKGSLDSAYGYERTWNATLRFVRVDLGMKVPEADKANGFILFEYRTSENGQKPTPGSFEIIRGNGDVVHVVLQLTQMPHYHEQMLLDKLAQKMREDYGDPPDIRAPAPAAPPDAGPDGNEENN
jgi:hypothetical protein